MNDTVEPKTIKPLRLDPVSQNQSLWIIAIGSFFGLVTLMGLFAFAYLTSSNPTLCSSFAFNLLAAGFALGAALAGGLISGGAGAQGRSEGKGFNLVFGVTGGAALLIITLTVFLQFAPQGCEVLNYDQMKRNLEKTQSELTSTQASLEETKAAHQAALKAQALAEGLTKTLNEQLSQTQDNLKKVNPILAETIENLNISGKALGERTTERDTALATNKTLQERLVDTQRNYAEQTRKLDTVTSERDSLRNALNAMTNDRNTGVSTNAALRSEIKRVVSAIMGAFPGAGDLAGSVSSIQNLVSGSCSGGPHGIDPANAGAIRSISSDASNRIASAQAAIVNIVGSVAAEFRP